MNSESFSALVFVFCILFVPLFLLARGIRNGRSGTIPTARSGGKYSAPKMTPSTPSRTTRIQEAIEEFNRTGDRVAFSNLSEADLSDSRAWDTAEWAAINYPRSVVANGTDHTGYE